MSIYVFKAKARDGEIVARFEPTASMKDVRAKVEEAL